MYILAIESSAVSAGAAILKDGVIISECFANIGLTHSRTLMTLIDTCLANAELSLSDMDILACAKGPGSFTGIRIGVSTLKGLAFAEKKPVYGISTLEAMGYSAAVPDVVICPVMDARCKQVYTALFEYKDKRLVRLFDDEPLKLDELEKRLQDIGKKVLFIGDGCNVAVEYFSKTSVNFCVFPEIYKFQHASAVAFAAFMLYNDGVKPIDAEELLPDYLRLSQAEREIKNKEIDKK